MILMKFRMRPLARLAPVFLAIATVWTQAQALDFGVNINLDNTTAALNTQRAAVMKPRNIKTARIGIVDSWNDTTARRDQAVKIVANGGTVQAGIFPSFTWDHSCNQDFASVEQKAYNETATAVNKVKDVIHDFELMNENQYRQEIASEVAPNSAGTQTAPYQGKPCIASLTAALRGMSRAIKDIRASSGLPLRVILGQAGRDWGFLTFMQQKGVQFDVVGWHVYQHYANESLLTDSWWGPGGPYAQMAAFGKPVTVNEFNCGETYLATYENLAGQPVTETCLKSIDKHLTDLINQTSVKIESVYAYEIVDEPQKAGPEDRFGLTYDLTRPKVHMYLYTAFAGGTLTTQQRSEITRRGLMTDAEVDARRRAAMAIALSRNAARPPTTRNSRMEHRSCGQDAPRPRNVRKTRTAPTDRSSA